MNRRHWLKSVAALGVAVILSTKTKGEFVGHVWFRERRCVPVIDKHGLMTRYRFPQTRWIGVGRTKTYYPATVPEQEHLRLWLPPGLELQPGDQVLVRGNGKTWRAIG
ncbi:MAG: hypothetical protein ACYTEQ_24225 [Planctomycetota bacterium]|jgi:hypothetical protein